jgi:hypothetical protein
VKKVILILLENVLLDVCYIPTLQFKCLEIKLEEKGDKILFKLDEDSDP